MFISLFVERTETQTKSDHVWGNPETQNTLSVSPSNLICQKSHLFKSQGDSEQPAALRFTLSRNKAAVFRMIPAPAFLSLSVRILFSLRSNNDGDNAAC